MSMRAHLQHRIVHQLFFFYIPDEWKNWKACSQLSPAKITTLQIYYFMFVFFCIFFVQQTILVLFIPVTQEYSSIRAGILFATVYCIFCLSASNVMTCNGCSAHFYSNVCGWTTYIFTLSISSLWAPHSRAYILNIVFIKRETWMMLYYMWEAYWIFFF